MNVYISVIITAYNRKEYLLNAIKSVFNQTLPKDKYEIIVVKNFNDDKIDDFINRNNIKNILMVGKLGEFLNAGIKVSNGNILSFLDDDDLFFSNKLEYVYNLFNNDAYLVYYHNNYFPINIKNEYIKFKNNSPDFNTSCINIKKDIINVDYLKKIFASPDTFMYLCALESNKKVIKNKIKLTYYTVHNSTSNTFKDNIEEFNNEQLEFINNILYNFYKFNDLFKLKESIRYINSQITNWEISKFSFNMDKKPGNLLDFILFNRTSIENTVIKIFMYSLIRIYPTYFRRYIQRKRFINSVKHNN